jgi:hypothetical protein
MERILHRRKRETRTSETRKSKAEDEQRRRCSTGGRAMKMIAYVLAVICVIAAVMYFALPGGSLPAFMPGYVEGSTHIHMLHGFAAVTGAIVFILVGLSRR